MRLFSPAAIGDPLVDREEFNNLCRQVVQHEGERHAHHAQVLQIESHNSRLEGIFADHKIMEICGV